MSDEFLTIRERIYIILKEAGRPITVEELGDLLGIPLHERKRLYSDISHLMLSVKRKSSNREKIIMIPAHCLDCGYKFKNREKTRKPSKCPKCGSQRIKGPWFQLVYR